MSARNPYPGLRPFHRNESDIFFGREEQTDDLLRRLDRNRFLAVVGESGCGKSSLVRAGLIAALEAGFLPRAGSRWCTAVMRPGSNPIERLLAALEESEIGDSEFDEGLKGLLRSTLNHGPKGLINALKRLAMPGNVNFLLVVDQFEELFRITRGENREQADAFVALLLNAVKQSDLSIYVVMTMRSDFLGETALFNGLPEAVNDGIYLTPRLSRTQKQSSIEGPARVYGGKVEPRVVNRILNEMASDRVQLPLLQHLLMRMWHLADHTALGDEADNQDHELTTSVGKLITEDQYKSAGKLGKALDDHAEEIFTGLTESQQRIAKSIFESLCERSKAGGKVRNIRRPTRIEEIAKIAGIDSEQVIEVANVFRGSECNFIAPELAEEIYSNSKIDLSHESLMLAWKRLSGWMDEESVHNETFDEMLKDAQRWEVERKESAQRAKQHLWDVGARAFRAQEWHEKAESSFEVLRPDDFNLVNSFAKASRQRRKNRRAIRWATGITAGLIALVFSANYLKDIWQFAGQEEAEDKYTARLGAFTGPAADNEFAPLLTDAGEGLIADFQCLGVVRAINAENAKTDEDKHDFTDAEIREQEAGWSESVDDILGTSCSLDLLEIQHYSEKNGLVEVFATDRLGRNVCMSQATSDYVQSDEGWWKAAFNTNSISIGSLEFDDSAGTFGVPIYLPVRDDNDEIIGAAKAVFNLFDLDTYEPLCAD